MDTEKKYYSTFQNRINNDNKVQCHDMLDEIRIKSQSILSLQWFIKILY